MPGDVASPDGKKQRLRVAMDALDEVKDQMPEGAYLTLCNAMKTEAMGAEPSAHVVAINIAPPPRATREATPGQRMIQAVGRVVRFYQPPAELTPQQRARQQAQYESWHLQRRQESRHEYQQRMRYATAAQRAQAESEQALRDASVMAARQVRAAKRAREEAQQAAAEA